jgi:isocitrate lyase
MIWQLSIVYYFLSCFNSDTKLSVAEMAPFREDLPARGYKVQFITLAGFHALNTTIFKLASVFKERGMAGYSILQEREFAL